MSKPSLSKHLVVGLPRTGKTSFIAALGHVVESGEVPNSLQLVDMGDVRDRVNAISKEWLSYREVDRTNFNTETNVVMKLSSPSGDKVVEILLPDMTGESFELQWKNREWSREYDELARESSGMLLFVHPDKIVEPVSIEEVVQIEAQITDAGGASVPESQAGVMPKPTPWNRDFAPTGIQLVELLQFFVNQKDVYPLARIAVIVSAWDKLECLNVTPEAWLSTTLPLLDQFLRASRNRVPFRIYGVSALGGDIEDPVDLQRMQKEDKPSNRIIVVGQDCGPHDISAPIKWLTDVGNE
ncbi:MAG TPA: hypothetical protein VMZ30_09955 [Pyrinomonadaceae bacterium]|nr:hypothetical protein [Pyrinomonadaceae bacterium]